jgi:hypothetical protein
MPRKKFRTVKLPARMIETCKDIVENHPECAWNSVAAFVQDAIRHYPYWEKHAFAKLS